MQKLKHREQSQLSWNVKGKLFPQNRAKYKSLWKEQRVAALELNRQFVSKEKEIPQKNLAQPSVSVRSAPLWMLLAVLLKRLLSHPVLVHSVCPMLSWINNKPGLNYNEKL